MTTTKSRKAKKGNNRSQGESAADQPQVKLRVDDAKADIHYSSTSVISATAEEVAVDFARGLKPGSRGDTAVLTVEAKVIMSPWAAKRLAIDLTDTIKRYELTYGKLEIDARKRRVDGDAQDRE